MGVSTDNKRVNLFSEVSSPNLLTIIKYVSPIPVTNAAVERVLKKLKPMDT
jgi:hypothetical protein